MKRKTVILLSILGTTIFSLFVAMNVMAEKDVPGPFATDKTERTMVKELIVGQREIKSMLQQINNKIDKIDSANLCKQ